jgi:hypothetical protein
MSKPWFAFFKRAAACVGVSAILALAIVTGSSAARAAPSHTPVVRSGEAAAPTALADSLPEREIVLSTRGGQKLRVGDTVAYTLEGGEAAAESRWAVDPKIGGLKMGFLIRPGKLFTPLMAGELSLPPIAILDENGATVARTKPVSIAIESNFSEKERNAGQPPKPEPALGPLGLPFPIWIQSAIAFTLLALVLIGAYFVVRFVRRKAAAALKKILPKKPYDLAALEKIDLLLKRPLESQKDFKALYFGVSETLKAYFGERFDFDAAESTTSELIANLKERNGTPGLNDSVISRVRMLFDRLDPVKFADVIPSVDEAKEIHREGRELIVTTRKVAAEPILKSGEPTPRKEAR